MFAMGRKQPKRGNSGAGHTESRRNMGVEPRASFAATVMPYSSRCHCDCDCRCWAIRSAAVPNPRPCSSCWRTYRRRGPGSVIYSAPTTQARGVRSVAPVHGLAGWESSGKEYRRGCKVDGSAQPMPPRKLRRVDVASCLVRPPRAAPAASWPVETHFTRV